MNTPALPAYAELHCLSNFTFLRGASHPKELVRRAVQLGYAALAIADECSMAGVVRAHVEAKARGLPLIIGAQFRVDDAPFTLVALAQNRNGYGNLCELISRLRRASPTKGEYRLRLADIDPTALADCLVLAAPERGTPLPRLIELARWLLTGFSGRCWFAVTLLRQLDDEAWLARLREAGELSAIPLVATGDVLMHRRSRQALQDVLSATRLGRPLTDCGQQLQPNAERHLRSRLRLSTTYPSDLLAETLRVAERCAFSLDELRYQYPAEVVPQGRTPASYLRELTERGAARRWPAGTPDKVRAQIEHELALIAELRYEHYFLTVADIVRFARGEKILCQGRGSAANSVVCYCLGVTEVDPQRQTVLFERFLSKERNEPPDIDVDFEHERREEVIQYLYRKYGRERAALTATVITYHRRSAIRDVGKALGFDAEAIDRLAKEQQWFDGRTPSAERLLAVGLRPDDLAVRQLIDLVGVLTGEASDQEEDKAGDVFTGFPRHLSQHVGGFVLTQDPLTRLVPVENAAMEGRTVIEWDKDDLDALGLLKVDVLALGMLTALRKALVFIGQQRGRPFALQDIPDGDDPTYDMICEADTIGVFQIESRAQQSMLPRLRPRTFYDLVIEVAIVRPGPIQGGMVHPYLNRRQGKEPVHFEKDELKPALERTLGVPVFQEQVMQLAIIAAGFTPGEADELRRAMAAWKRKGGLHKYHEKIVKGMTGNGYSAEFAERIYQQIHGFSDYGFPESHAASFALLVYASCWIKCHHPAAFLAAMLNSQPLGFYTPSQLVQDAQRHGVEVRPVDVCHSDRDCTLEDLPREPVVRLGLNRVGGLSRAAADRIAAARRDAPFQDAEDLARRAGLDRRELQALAAADALIGLSGHRRLQMWDAAGHRAPPALLRQAPVHEAPIELPPAPEGEAIVWDYAATRLTLRRHPLALLRPQLRARRLMTAEELKALPDKRFARACGIVTVRQQPQTANGTIFVSLEDETGAVQVIVWRHVRERQRAELLHARLLAVHGVWQREGPLCNLIAGRLEDLTPLLGRLATESRDFH
ncbi:error-prone DNA polymerase [Hydrogenophaga sp. PML113]|uniref:error-prone DNA polymerase n=1 Tax=Hydrogenophaga sp. PML113 TaxID=1899350 RepID=UPI00087802DC|nr:error-prone DNA polymerase [Hydrogenophaga sp. PML113]